MKFAKILISLVFAFAVMSGCMGGEGFEPQTNRSLGMRAFRDSDFNAAINHLNRAMEETPYDVGIIFPLAIAYGITGNEDREFELFQRSVEVDPEFYPGFYHMALVYSERGYTQRALEVFTRVIELNPEHDNAHYAIGLIHEAHSPRTALTFFQRAAELGNRPATAKVQELESRLGINTMQASS